MYQYFVGANTDALAAGIAFATGSRDDITLFATEPYGGTSPYTYQWYRSTSSGFTPDASNDIVGATSLTYTDEDVDNGTTYYYVLIATDTALDTVTYTEVSASPVKGGHHGIHVGLRIGL